MILTNEIQHKVLNHAIRVTSVVALLFAVSFLTSCDDDDENGFPSVQGKWVGDKTEIFAKIKGFPQPIDETDESFAGRVDFKQNGTAVYSEDGEEIIGSWLQNNDKLSLTIPKTDDVDMSGTYTIKEITRNRLKIYIEKETTIEDPDTGLEVEASIKATMYFDRN